MSRPVAHAPTRCLFDDAFAGHEKMTAVQRALYLREDAPGPGERAKALNLGGIRTRGDEFEGGTDERGAIKTEQRGGLIVTVVDVCVAVGEVDELVVR